MWWAENKIDPTTSTLLGGLLFLNIVYKIKIVHFTDAQIIKMISVSTLFCDRRFLFRSVVQLVLLFDLTFQEYYYFQC